MYVGLWMTSSKYHSEAIQVSLMHDNNSNNDNNNNKNNKPDAQA